MDKGLPCSDKYLQINLPVMTQKIDPSYLIQQLNLKYPLIGLYDAPDKTAFIPFVEAKEGKWACIFQFFHAWENGQTLRLTSQNYGCGGAGYWLFGKESRNRAEFISFLCDQEGLKANHPLMDQWLDYHHPYQPQNEQLFIGPLKEGQEAYLKTITFYVNPDQLSALMTGAQYFLPPGRTIVSAPFGSGCMQLLPLFDDLEIPLAIVGATDIAMRKFLPEHHLMAFTVTLPMFELLCSLDEKSFLSKPFLEDLKKSRGGKL